MRIQVRQIAFAVLVLAGLVISGCLPAIPSGQDRLEEEREPHYLAGVSLVNAMDYQGAIERFEKALEVNPRSASAHFQLGWLFEQKVPDPAAAIYHYNRYLQLRPQAENTETVKQRIAGCKQELARTVLLGPVNQKVQLELEQLTEEKKHLTDQNKLLSDEVAKWRAYYASQQGAANLSGPRSLAGTGAGPSTLGSTTLSNASSSLSGVPAGSGAVRTHTVKAGETPTSIARQYGVRLEALLAANPKLEPRRMRVGQPLTIPPR